MGSNGAETASQSRSGRSAERSERGRAGRLAGAAARLGGFARRHGTTLVAFTAVLGGLLLLYAETLDLYRIVTPSGSISNATGSVRTGGDHHSWALGIVGAAGAGAALLARATHQRLPAMAALALGAIALITVLAADLPDVTASGVTTDLEVGDAEPAAGFWMELVGAVLLTGGAALLARLLRPARDAARRRGGVGAPR